MRIAGPPTGISGRQWPSEERRWESERRQCGTPRLRFTKRATNDHRRRPDGRFRGPNGACRPSNDFRQGSEPLGRARARIVQSALQVSAPAFPGIHLGPEFFPGNHRFRMGEMLG